MACIDIVFPPLPDIFPLVLTPPALPSIDLSIDFCCRLSLTIVPPPIPLGPLVLAIPGASAALITLNAQIALINSYLDALPLSCPFDDQAES
jgi:hypothetical protein